MKFVVIEGLDGSGKSTQLNLLKEYLEKKDIKYKYLHFPRTDSPVFGELVAMFLRGDLGDIDEVHPYIAAMLYAGDRNDAKGQINDWLENNYLVVVDRYVYSNIAYQCAKMPDEQEKDKLRSWILKVEYEYFKIPKPDINIFLDVPFGFVKERLAGIRTGDDRKYLDGKKDIHEKDVSFQEKVRREYLQAVKTDPGLKLINCTDENNEILQPESIISKILLLLNKSQII